MAGEIAGPKPSRWREDAPGERRFLGDAEIDTDLADGCDIAIFRHAVDAQHATKIGDRADDEADARGAAAFENADLNALHRLLRIGAGERRNQHGDGETSKYD